MFHGIRDAGQSKVINSSSLLHFLHVYVSKLQNLTRLLSKIFKISLLVLAAIRVVFLLDAETKKKVFQLLLLMSQPPPVKVNTDRSDSWGGGIAAIRDIWWLTRAAPGRRPSLPLCLFIELRGRRVSERVVQLQGLDGLMHRATNLLRPPLPPTAPVWEAHRKKIGTKREIDKIAAQQNEKTSKKVLTKSTLRDN